MKDVMKTEQMCDMRVYTVSTYIFKMWLTFYHRLEVRGVENLPEHGGVLIVSNHASYIDPPAIGSSIRTRPIHFMARDTLWNSTFGSWWMTSVGCIPVTRGTGDMRALKLMVAALKKGKVMSLFPEGTRTEDGELKEAKAGVGFIVKKSGCTVLPCYIDGSFEAYPKGGKWPKPLKVTVNYGKPIPPEEIDAFGEGRESYDKIALLIMERIAALKSSV